MDIATMHIGIDLGLQKSNSNVFGDLQREEKDYFLNKTIKSFVLTVLNKENNSVSSIESYLDISKYYTGLQPFIRTEELNKRFNTLRLVLEASCCKRACEQANCALSEWITYLRSSLE